jgi:hypothetical protein
VFYKSRETTLCLHSGGTYKLPYKTRINSLISLTHLLLAVPFVAGRIHRFSNIMTYINDCITYRNKHSQMNDQHGIIDNVRGGST